MYVAPRPLAEDDPLFAVRLALMPVIGFIIGMALRSPMVMVFPTLMLSMTAGNRGAFDPGRVLAAPLMFASMLWIMSGVVALLYQTPVALVMAMMLVYFAGFYLIQVTGSGLGMLVIVAAALTSIMGLGSYDVMMYLRAEMTKAALCTAMVAPILYMLLPVRTTVKHVDVYTPADEHGRVTRSLIRAVVMLGFSLYLYVILDPGNVMLAVAGMFVLVFSTRETMWREAAQRSFSVMLGGGLTLLILGLLTLSGHLFVLLGLVFLATLWCGQRMLSGRLPSMAYQDTASIMISMVGSALASSDPTFAFAQRAGLTVIGTIVAALLVTLLDQLLVGRRPLEPTAGERALAGT